MKQCEFCGASMADAAGFCGKCGRLPSRISRHSTHVSDIPTIHTSDVTYQDDNQTIQSISGQHTALRTPGSVLHPVTLLPLYDQSENEDAQEEERRRAALLGIGLPLLAEIADQLTLGQAPVIQGTPQMAQVPVVPNTPQMAQVSVIPNTPQIHGGAAFGPGAPTVAGNPPLLPHIQPPQPLPLPSPARHLRSLRNATGQSPRSFAGCLPLGAIFLATILIILLTTIGLSLTTFAPGLALSGSSTVSPGSNLILHGHNFLPNGSVTLTLDNGIVLPSTQGQTPVQLAQRSPLALPDTALTLDTPFIVAAHNTISTHSDGTFTATILISSSWTPGHHTIYASEAVSRRSASLPFTIASINVSATPTPTATQPTPTVTPSPTPTATATLPPTLSCATPGHLSLGPISEFSSQLVSARVTLCTTGAGTLTWKASWNQNQSPWLQIKQSSGSIQAPNQVQTTISASAAKLAAGIYTTSVTFTGLESNTSQTVGITLTVKAGCVSATPQSLSFSGVEGSSDPGSAQNISITNCGLASNWSATIDNSSDWLSLSSSQGTLQSGDTGTIAVTASNLNAKLKAGTYQDTITFTIGSNTSTVKVSLIVQAAPPTISASPASLDAASSPCTSNENGSNTCAITLTNQSSATALTWSASADGNGVNIQADSTTIPAGGTEQVTIVVPASNCGTQLTITFKAPGNSANVTWNCTPQAPIR